MFYIAINTIFNAFLLSIVLILGSSLGNHSPETYLYIVILSYAISTILTLIGFSRIGTAIVGLFVSGRNMIGREKVILEPLFSDVIEQTNHEYGTSYKLSDFKIKVSDDKTVNAFALGYNVLIVNRGAFDAFTHEQLRAILGHEMGHLYYRDSVKSISLIFSAYATRLIMTIYAVFMAFTAGFANNTRGKIQGASVIAYYIIFALFLPVIFLNWLGNKVFTLINRKISRAAEYRADAFSASLGYKADMIASLEILDNLSSGYNNSFIGKLMSTHPATMLRIGALEDEQVAKEKIGGAFVAVPFATDNKQHVNSSRDFVMLATILLLFGVVWVGSTAFDTYKRMPISSKSSVGEIATLVESPAMIADVISSPEPTITPIATPTPQVNVNNKKVKKTTKVTPQQHHTSQQVKQHQTTPQNDIGDM